MDATDLCFTPATELARLYRSKTLSPVEVAEAVLRRIEALNPRLNAFLALRDRRVQAVLRAGALRSLGRLLGGARPPWPHGAHGA